MAGNVKKSTIKKITVTSKASPAKKAATGIKKNGQVRRKPFPIVGIGASAGGLAAFNSLLENLPGDLGMAYVFIQHLSPSYESYLPEILERKTKMKVQEVSNNLEVKKNCAYVIPPNKTIIINDGKFKVSNRPRDEKFFHPIDYFFTSLASTYKQNAIGIVLSGTATDGSLGLKAIKAEGGITFAQDDSADYTGMPQNAVEMGYVDFVMSPEKIAKELASLIKHPFSVKSQNQYLVDNKTELRKIHMIMHQKRNVDFSHYKQTTIQRRIMRRMVLNRLKDLSQYERMLKNNPAEVDALYQDLLITVTNFFRDQHLYNALTTKILPVLLKNRKSNNPLRIWIPGCATGEEAVSMAIILLEYLGDKAFTTPIQIFATDLNEKAIDRSRSGIYFKSALQNVSQQRLKRFFVKVDGAYQVIKTIRDMCIFAPHNLLKDPPFSRMDIISCQNVLIYLESLPQNKIMHAFHYALKPTGYLILGKSETIGTATDLFEQLDKDNKIYTKKALATLLPLDFASRRFSAGGPGADEEEKQEVLNPRQEIDLEKETEKLLLSRYIPASVVVNKDLEILRFRGVTSRYLEPAAGKASLNLMKMIKEEIAFELRTLIHRVKKEDRPVKKEGLYIGSNGQTKELSIEVTPLKGNGKQVYYLVIFKEGSSHTIEDGKRASQVSQGVKDNHIVALEHRLKEARENIKIMSEEFEATKEELQSANEEILSSNEELQSINEELETSKEELQSTNEELTTINEELHNRNIELRSAGDYAEAIIETLHESLLMLTDDLKIKTANKGFYTTFQTTPEETEGHYLYELGDNQWDIPALRTQLRSVQSKNTQIVFFEVDHVFPKIGKKTMLLNAQRVVLRGGRESLILLAIQDITDRKQRELGLQQSEERFRLLIQNSSDIITVFDRNGNIKYQSPAVESILGYKPEERIGKNIFKDPITHPDDKKIEEDMLKKAIANPDGNIHAEFRMLHKAGGVRVIDAISRNYLGNERIEGIVATYRDITERKALEQQKDDFIGIASHELKTPVTSIKAYAQIIEDNLLKAKDLQSAQLLSKMNTQIDRLTTLIIDLLDFTRIEGGQLKFKKERYGLNELVSEIVEEMQNTTTQHTIVKKLGKNIRVTGDRYRTGQVITNLLSNAIKYSPVSKKVIVTTKVTTANFTVCVQDFGIGIEHDYLNNIFDRFFRVSEPLLNTFPGLGLGLYIASEIIRRQHGKIWVTSDRGKGSIFCFSLPLKRKPERG